MTDEEIIAKAKTVSRDWSRGDHARIEPNELARLIELAARGPVMPEEPTEEMLDVMCKAVVRDSGWLPWDTRATAYRELRAHLMKKPRKRWAVNATWATSPTTKTTHHETRSEAEDAAVAVVKMGANNVHIVKARP